jgi:hypothetical protein
MKNISLLQIVVITILMTACNTPTVLQPTLTQRPPAVTQPPPTTTQPPTPTSPPSPTPAPLDPQQIVLSRAAEVVLALKNQDMLGLAGYVHPVNGLRFSPYAYVQDTNLVFPAEQVASLLSDETNYQWGFYDGSGMNIDLSFSAYFAEFIYDVDFANAAQISVNQRIGLGNSIDNSAEYYPNAIIIEYHFPGFDASYQGMDWRSLRLVFQEYSGVWYLVGIIHDEWTI